MSDNEVNNEKSAEEIVIEINGEENVKDNNEDNILNKAETKFVERKQVSSLTEEERNLIIANAKAGIDQPYYEVKTFKIQTEISEDKSFRYLKLKQTGDNSSNKNLLILSAMEFFGELIKPESA